MIKGVDYLSIDIFSYLVVNITAVFTDTVSSQLQFLVFRRVQLTLTACAYNLVSIVSFQIINELVETSWQLLYCDINNFIYYFLNYYL